MSNPRWKRDIRWAIWHAEMAKEYADDAVKHHKMPHYGYGVHHTLKEDLEQLLDELQKSAFAVSKEIGFLNARGMCK